MRENSEAGLAGMTGAHVTTFLLDECSRVSVGSAKGRVAELRSLLRFLYVAGIIPTSLAGSVPPVAGWQHTGIPRSMTTENVERLLGSCDRTGPLGMRDFAILILVARLGLRSIEISRLELDDLDWRAGEFVVRGKARRLDRLPLPAEVGQALADYLANARPDSDHRKVFVTARGPHRAIPPDLVSDVVRRACRRAGLAPVGAHRLRHALATGMLAAGVDMTAISQVLRHSDIATTAIYAKVDIASLQHVAAPWPGARP
jgi:site-specific recombinase XerD